MGLQTHGLVWRLLATLLALGLAGISIWGRIPDPVRDPATADSLPPPPDIVSLRILNGSGMAGLARTVQRFFLGYAGETVFVMPFEPSDADRDDYATTIVVSHVPGPEAARAASAMLGLGDSSIVWSVENDPPTDLTVYLGRDVAARRDEFIPVEQ